MEWDESFLFDIPSEPYYATESFFDPSLDSLLSGETVSPTASEAVNASSVKNVATAPNFELEQFSIDHLSDIDVLDNLLNDDFTNALPSQATSTQNSMQHAQVLNPSLSDIPAQSSQLYFGVGPSACVEEMASGCNVLEVAAKSEPIFPLLLPQIICDEGLITQAERGRGTDSGFCSPATYSECNSPREARPTVPVVPELGYDLDTLHKMELDIAKLKTEVDLDDDKDSMWSDLFSECDASEIPGDYNNLLEDLLNLPVDDIDLKLNVFNEVDNEPHATDFAPKSVLRVKEELEDPLKVKCLSVEELRERVFSDHNYCLPPSINPEAPGTFVVPVMSDTESLLTNKTYENVYIKEEVIDVNSKIVELNHASDLNVVLGVSPLRSVSNISSKTVTIVPNKNFNRILSSNSRSLLKKNVGHSSQRRSVASSHQIVLKKVNPRSKSDVLETAQAVRSLIDNQPELRSKDGERTGSKLHTDRELHNSMERQRRVELKHEFDSLKSLVPEIAHTEKVSKLNVLNGAAKYVERLHKAESKAKVKIEFQKARRKQLLERLNSLTYN